MKKGIFFLLVSFLSVLAFGQAGKTTLPGQNNKTQKIWNTGDPFGTNVFVENLGQFDSWTKSAEPIKYAINSSNKIFFTQKGLVIRCDKIIKKSEEENEEYERKYGQEATPETDMYYITMTWEGSNASATIEASEQSEGYFTFGEKGYESEQAKGFRKIVYHDLYPGIDVEYIIPDKGGIEYSLILHPGADISQVKMKYTGDVNNIKKDKKGNIIISTPAGDITDHHPESFYQSTNAAVTSEFELNDKLVTFSLEGLSSAIIGDKTIVIDPWTIIPSSLSSDNSAFDIDYDDHGNVYASGGTVPYKVAKYTSSGTLVYTFTNPTGWAMDTYYSKFCVLPATGTVYISEGYNYGSGPAIMKLNQAGNLILTSPNFAGSNEIWAIYYNRCTEQLVGFGGGTSNQNNFHVLADTNLTGESITNFNGYTGGCCNDITSAVMDNNGDFYALMTSASGTPSVNNNLQKSLMSSNYLPPCAFDVTSGYFFEECYNYGISGFMASQTVRANVLAVNNDYLYSYDGMILKAWNKTTGASLGSIVVNSGYAAGENRTHEGIAADDCNNVYVGGTNKVHVFSFDGSTFTIGTSIVSGIPNEVYDIKLNRMTTTLYVSGYGFVTVTPTTMACTPSVTYNCSAAPNHIFTDNNIYVCSNSATISAGQNNNLTNYLWSTGDIASTTVVTTSGMYYLTATWNSSYTIVDSIHVTLTHPYMTLNLGNDTTFCGNGGVHLNAGTGFADYLWNTGSTNSSIHVSHTGIYSVVTTDTANCSYTDTVRIIINPAHSLNLGNDTVICNYAPFPLDASVAFDSYLWSTGATTQTINVQSSGTYAVTATNNLCSVTAIDTITVIVHGIPIVNAGIDRTICNGSNTTLNASGTGTYAWSPSAGLSCTNCASPTASPNQTTTYVVTVTNSSGCTASDDVTLTVITASVSITSASCGQPNGSATVTINGSSGSYYLSWSSTPAQYTLTAVNLSPGTYTVSVTDMVAGCTVTTSGTVGNIPSPMVSISNIVNANCGMNSGSMKANITGGSYPYTYLWNSTPPQTTQTLVNVPPGTYCVTITDINGCTASHCDSIGTIVYPAPDICMVSVDTASNYNIVIWEKPVTTGINKYYIYRESSVFGIYNLIATQNYSDYSSFVDVTSNSLQQPYRYELAINDNCGFTSVNSAFHQTIHLAISAGMSGSWNLNWNDYLGFIFSTYNIYRGTNPGNMSLLNAVSSSVTSYSDVTPPSGVVYYLVEAVRPTACNPSKSFTSTISNIASSNGLGIAEESIDNLIKVYPDPATDNLTIESPSRIKIDLLNVQGQLIKTVAASNSKTEIDVSALPTGVYIVEVKTEKGVGIGKFVKE